jgi:hypothetical protein
MERGTGHAGRMKTRALLIVLALLALTGSAIAATPERVFAQKASSGGFAAVKVSGTALKPATLRVRVTTVPRQNVLVNYTLICSKSGTSKKDVKQFPPVMSPSTRSVALTVAKPAKCTLAATGQLESGEGRITIQLLKRTR